MQSAAEGRTPSSTVREPEPPRMPAYLQPLAFVSSGVIQPDVLDEPPPTSSTGAGLGFMSTSADQPAGDADVADSPAADSRAAGLGFKQPAAAAAVDLGSAPPSAHQPAGAAQLDDRPSAGSAAADKAFAGLGFEPSSAEQPLPDRRMRVPSSLVSRTGMLHIRAAAPADELAEEVATWLERHVDAAAAASFERVAGEALHAVLRRGLLR